MFQFIRDVKALQRAAEFFLLGALFILPFSKAGLEIFLTAAIISWFIFKFISKEPLCRNQFLFLICGVFIAVSSVSAFYSGYPEASLKGMIKLIKYILVMLIAFDLFNGFSQIKRLIIVLTTGLFFVLVDSAAQFVFEKDPIVGMPLHFTNQQIRITGPFNFYGLLAAYLIVLTPLIMSLFFYSKRVSQKVLFILIGFAALIALYKSHSRGAWIAGFGSWLCFALMMKKKIAFAIVLVIFLVVPFFLPYNALIHLDSERKEQSLIERYYLWDRAIQTIKAKPIFGCGINTYIKNYPQYDKTKNWRVPGYYAHNGYLQLAAETGLPALLLFLWILGMSICSGYKTFQNVVSDKKIVVGGLICGLIALLLQALVDTTLHNLQAATLIWFFIGLLLSINDPKITQPTAGD